MPSIANILLEITGNPDSAKHALGEVAAALQAFGRQDATAEAKIDGDQAKRTLDSLDARLTEIGSRSVTAEVKVDVDQARARLSVLRRELATALAGGQGARPLGTILSDIGSLGTAIDRAFTEKPRRSIGVFSLLITSAFQRAEGRALRFGNFLERTVGRGLDNLATRVGRGVLSGIGGLAGLLDSAGRGMVSLAGSALVAGTRMAGMAVLIGGLVVALIPLIGSLGAATVGFGALSVSMAGSLIPVLGVLIASFVKLSEIIKATEQHEQTAAQRRQQAAVSAQQEAAAQRQLADAYRNLHDQTVAADQARQDAAQAVQEDMAAVRNAELSAEQSHINLLRAQQDLKDFRKQNGLAQQDVSKLFQRFQDVDFNVSRKQLGAMIKDVTGRNLGADQQIQLMQLLLNVKTARQGEKDAANSLHDSQVKLNRDRATEAKFLSQGLKAYPAYAQAVRQVADAKRAEASASQAAKAQAATSDQAYQKLTKQQRQIGENLDDLGKKAKRFFDPIILRVACRGFCATPLSAAGSRR
jgi:hypothetical protein